MSYYKITYESNTIEGLKAIQGDVGQGGNSFNSTGSESSVPPPLQAGQNSDIFSSGLQAPPALNDGSGNLDISNGNTDNPLPPPIADSVSNSVNSEGAIPPPPKE
ncbi:hypothetical protein [Dyadobacter sp. CY326]|uniref:hypothetical protein n=1 Tax=Dyadobacter sp. CY326 TaxID=2907300 RepID=UPI001F44BE34|nr:hypothetical protein [Dyadobacter sp. CY326]MCE7066997.1 hypothetical protein [Dyadobacter sp. CY326]